MDITTNVVISIHNRYSSAEKLAGRIRFASDKMKWRSELAYLVVGLKGIDG